MNQKGERRKEKYALVWDCFVVGFEGFFNEKVEFSF